MSKKISIYVRNKQLGPSCYYRIVQYVPFLNNKNVKIHESVRNNLYLKYYSKRNLIHKIILYVTINFKRFFSLIHDLFARPKIIVVQREIVPKYCSFIILFLLFLCSKHSDFIWDFDDSILEGKEISKREFSFLEKRSKTIVVTHDNLRDTIDRKYRDKVFLLPTNDAFFTNGDFVTVKEKREALFHESLNLIWIGTFSNIHFNNIFAESLDLGALKIRNQLGKKVVFTVVSNAPFNYSFSNIELNNVVWTREISQKLMMTSHIGLMPLEDSKYVRGKGGFKLIQYLSSGIPVIASNVGFNRDIVDDGYNGYLIDDSSRIVDLIFDIAKNKNKWSELSFNALSSYNTKFPINKNIDFWRHLLDE